MNINSEEYIFLNQIIEEIKKADKLHTKKIIGNVEFLSKEYPGEYALLLKMIHSYFININYSPVKVAEDYLKMVRDMRKEGLYFYKHNEYCCKSQDIANQNVYSRPEIMSYYMSALLISQILWKHHFCIFIYFKKRITDYFDEESTIKILDIGPGHGFFSFFIKETIPEFESIDFVDISETSLAMTKKIIGENDKLNYYLKDIFDFDESEKYDFIVLGEVLEHLDKPQDILRKLARLLSDKGILWITTPTNSPALDHVYLFKTKEEVVDLIKECDLEVDNSVNYFAEDVTEEIALERRITNLVGLFCRK
jgi:2-polyprenyl-3-methyl-5-hydroxy-6-metoxy-1,4-benzoquinol methylase